MDARDATPLVPPLMRASTSFSSISALPMARQFSLSRTPAAAICSSTPPSSPCCAIPAIAFGAGCSRGGGGRRIAVGWPDELGVLARTGQRRGLTKDYTVCSAAKFASENPIVRWTLLRSLGANLLSILRVHRRLSALPFRRRLPLMTWALKLDRHKA
jgi:hypothetical protein